MWRAWNWYPLMVSHNPCHCLKWNHVVGEYFLLLLPPASENSVDPLSTDASPTSPNRNLTSSSRRIAPSAPSPCPRISTSSPSPPPLRYAAFLKASPRNTNVSRPARFEVSQGGGTANEIAASGAENAGCGPEAHLGGVHGAVSSWSGEGGGGGG